MVRVVRVVEWQGWSGGEAGRETRWRFLLKLKLKLTPSLTVCDQSGGEEGVDPSLTIGLSRATEVPLAALVLGENRLKKKAPTEIVRIE